MQLTLKAIRVNNNWSLEETARKYNVSVDTIRNYENYKTYPNVPIINNILEATNLNYEDIIFLPQNCENYAKMKGKTIKKIQIKANIV